MIPSLVVFAFNSPTLHRSRNLTGSEPSDQLVSNLHIIIPDLSARNSRNMLRTSRSMLKQRPLLVFFPTAFILSWYPFILGKTHLVRTSGGINPLGPMVAAIIVASTYYRGRGLKELWGRYLRWRIGWSNYFFALILPVSVVGVSAVLNILLGADEPARAKIMQWPELLPRFVFIFLFVGLGEETGWRGFALPELQKRLSPLAASLILGVIWAAWHIPLFGVEFKGPVIPAFLMSVLSASVVSAWLFNRSSGSLLPQPLFHAVEDTVAPAYVFSMFQGADLLRLWWIESLLWVLVAVLSVLLSPFMTKKPPWTACENQERPG